jgi:hypothetical protein
MANPLSDQDVETHITQLGNYRVKRIQQIAKQFEPYLTGAHLLALGLRETFLQNIEGGAKWDDEAKKWVQAYDDVGLFQISRRYNTPRLNTMEAVVEGTWGPVIPGKTPAIRGYCPRFEDSIQYMVHSIHDHLALTEDWEIPEEDRGRMVLAGHNAGMGGALKGYKEGDVDKYSADGDYSGWILERAAQVERWLADHPGWIA